MKLRDVARSTVTMTHMGEKRAVVVEERDDRADAVKDLHEMCCELHLSLSEMVELVERLKHRGAVLSGVEARTLERGRRLLDPNEVFGVRGRRRARFGEASAGRSVKDAGQGD